MLHDLLDFVLPACKIGLEDPDDDVRAVAAEALIPTSAAIVALKGSTLHSIIMLLWDILLGLDDLSPSTSSVMNLLAEIYFQEQIIPKTFGSLDSKEKVDIDLNEYIHTNDLGEGMSSQENPFMVSTLAPRLWPFMRHSITWVRLSAIRTLECLLEAGYRRSIIDEGSSFWPSFIVGDMLRIVFQNLLLESNGEILQCSERVWNLLLKNLSEDFGLSTEQGVNTDKARIPLRSFIFGTKHEKKPKHSIFSCMHPNKSYYQMLRTGIHLSSQNH